MTTAFAFAGTEISPALSLNDAAIDVDLAHQPHVVEEWRGLLTVGPPDDDSKATHAPDDAKVHIRSAVPANKVARL